MLDRQQLADRLDEARVVERPRASARRDLDDGRARDVDAHGGELLRRRRDL